MNLQSRFGFHFCAVEALAGERRRENYISFSFKGGAADAARRLGRVRFIGGIMEDQGFRVESTEDNLNARLERHEQEVTLETLKAVGYLLMHTRQLDIIMGNPGPWPTTRTRSAPTWSWCAGARLRDKRPPVPPDPPAARPLPFQG